MSSDLGTARALVLGILVAIAACGKVQGMAHGGDDVDAGTDTGGGACTTNDQCAAPTPVCDPGNGCVECVQSDQCPAESPTCDTTTHTCHQCVLDSDCDSEVCDPASGSCVAETDVLYASPTGPDAGTCPKNSPCSIVQAAAVADQTRNNIKLDAGNYAVHLVMTNKTLTFYGTGATIASIGTNSVFEVDDNAHLRVVGASLTSATGSGTIRCEGSASATHVLELYGASLDNNNTTLLANPCTVTAEQTTFHDSNQDAYQIVIVAPSTATFNRSRFLGAGSGLISINNAATKITNSIITNAFTASAHGAFVGGAFDVSFSTIVDSFFDCGSQGATALTLNSSIVFNTVAGVGDTMQNGNMCGSVQYSLISPNAQPVGATNLNADPQFKNKAANDFHPLVTSPALDHGDPASTNTIDFDGTTRPKGAGPDSGAFEYKP